MSETIPPPAPLSAPPLPPLHVERMGLYDSVDRGEHEALRAPRMPKGIEL